MHPLHDYVAKQVLPLKLVDGLPLGLADGHHPHVRVGTDCSMAIAAVRAEEAALPVARPGRGAGWSSY
jgi:hypothetical protein